MSSNKNLDKISYSALGMSDETSLSGKSSSTATNTTARGLRNVNFQTFETLPSSTTPNASRRGSKFLFQRPRSMSAISAMSASSMRFDER
uniref:CSON000401 protein n=1 Tax=Culicoides sonorensis TaxID=179676 RepID=A0A336LUM2_CULSO